MSGVYRHGMRYPSNNDLDNVAQVLFEMKGLGVENETLIRLQSVVTQFRDAGLSVSSQ